MSKVALLDVGWITDEFGVTWQIVPRRFMELISDTNANKVQAVMDAMMKTQCGRRLLLPQAVERRPL